MLVWYIGGLTFIISCILLILSSDYSFEDILCSIGIALAITACVSVFVCCIVGAVSFVLTQDATEYRYQTEQKLVALADSSSVNGTLFVISTQDKYYYYKEVATGVFEQGSISSTGVKIIESDTLEPQIRLRIPVLSPVITHLFIVKPDRKEIIVPKGTVKNVFNLDLEK